MAMMNKKPYATGKSNKIYNFLTENDYRSYGENKIKAGYLFQKKTSGNHFINVYWHVLDPEQYPSLSRRSESFSMEIYFESMAEGYSNNVQIYGLSFSDLQENLENLEKRLLNAIPAMAGHPTEYSPDGSQDD